MNDTEQTTNLIPQDAEQKLAVALDYLTSIQGVTVTNQNEFEAANSVTAQLKGHIKNLEDKRLELVKPYKAKSKVIDDRFAVVRNALLNGATKIGAAVSAYRAVLERQRRQAQAIAGAAAEEKRKKEAAAAQKEIDKVKRYRTEGREEMAENAEARAVTHLDLAENTVAPVQESVKLKGTSFVDHWTAEVTDFEKAVPACMASPFTRAAVKINDKELERAQRQAKGELKLEGVQFTFAPQARHGSSAT